MEKATRKGILLMNLGSPDSTEVKDVRRYLNEFLMDERVIDMPYLSRFFLVKGIITPFRAPKSAEAYRTIWTKEGSPLIILTKQLKAALQQQVDLPIEIAMRYGNPTVKHAFDALLKKEIKAAKKLVEYAPSWIILMISISLGLGTMVGWKRIVKTVGEKIGKQHMSYAQGASAELVASIGIGMATAYGMPVSTTHMLSSGIAGTMVAKKGLKNLQKINFKLTQNPATYICNALNNYQLIKLLLLQVFLRQFSERRIRIQRIQ